MSAQLVSTLISALGTMIVARMLVPENYGSITVAMVPINIAMLFRDMGVNSALTKYISQYRYEEKGLKLSILLKTGLGLNLGIGLILTVLIFSISGFLSRVVFQDPGLQVLIQVASLDLMGQNLLTSSKAVFAGYERMELHSMLTIIYSVLRTILAPLLVFMNYGAFGAVTGHTIPLLLSGMIGVVLVFLYFMGSSKSTTNQLRGAANTIMSYGFPLFFSGILGGSLTHLYNFLMALYADKGMIGNYSAATNFGVLVSFFTMPIATTLFPLFSKLDYREGGTLRTVYQLSVKYVAIITLPIVAGMISLSDQIIKIVYPSGYQFASYFLTLYALNFLFIGLGSLGLGNLLNSQGKTNINFRGTLINVFLGIPLGVLLIPRYGVTGLLISQLLTKAGLIYNLWWTWKNFGFSIDWISSIKIFLSAGSATATVILILTNLELSYIVEFLVGGSILVAIYSIGIVILGVVDEGDISNLRKIVLGLGPLTPLFELLLNFLESLIQVKSI
jgi:O-antigen/teichoic acid export membrane protein